VIPLYLLEPEDPGAAWAPFTGVRPIAELRAGLWRIRERWSRSLGLQAEGILGTHIDGFHEFDEPPSSAPPVLTGPAVVAASWFAPAPRAIPLAAETRRLVHNDASVAWIVPPGERFERGNARGRAVPVDGVPLAGTHSLLDALEKLLAEDCAAFRGRGSAPPDAVVLGDPAEVVSLGAAVEPGVVFDVRSGPVVLEAGVEVRSGTRIEGPTFVGAGTRVLGGYVRGSESPSQIAWIVEIHRRQEAEVALAALKSRQDCRQQDVRISVGRQADDLALVATPAEAKRTGDGGIEEAQRMRIVQFLQQP